MDHIENPTMTTEHADGAAQTTKPDRARTRRLIAVATGTTIALGGGGVAYAASTADPTPTPTPSSSTPSDVTPDDADPDELRGDGPGPHGPGGGFMGAHGFGVLHGEAVVETEDGTYETVATQRGTIDEITDDSVTVTSEDGYTATYVLDADALAAEDRGPVTDPADLAAGDEVMVTATLDGSTATVEHLVDLANLPDMPAGPPGRSHGDAAPEADTEASPDTAAS